MTVFTDNTKHLVCCNEIEIFYALVIWVISRAGPICFSAQARQQCFRDSSARMGKQGCESPWQGWCNGGRHSERKLARITSNRDLRLRWTFQLWGWELQAPMHLQDWVNRGECWSKHHGNRHIAHPAVQRNRSTMCSLVMVSVTILSHCRCGASVVHFSTCNCMSSPSPCFVASD